MDEGIDIAPLTVLDIGIFVLQGDTNGIEEDALSFHIRLLIHAYRLKPAQDIWSSQKSSSIEVNSRYGKYTTPSSDKVSGRTAAPISTMRFPSTYRCLGHWSFLRYEQELAVERDITILVMKILSFLLRNHAQVLRGSSLHPVFTMDGMKYFGLIKRSISLFHVAPVSRGMDVVDFSVRWHRPRFRNRIDQFVHTGCISRNRARREGISWLSCTWRCVPL